MRSVLLLLVGLNLLACSDTTPGAAGPVSIDDSGGRVLIRDVTGKQWDVTEARNRYGILPGEFEHGLGPTAIPPINNPNMLLPGEPGYPTGGDFLLIGVVLNGSARSYPLQAMGWHEVANERFGDAHVSVAY